MDNYCVDDGAASPEHEQSGVLSGEDRRIRRAANDAVVAKDGTASEASQVMASR
jgi:hypothetical protein